MAKNERYIVKGSDDFFLHIEDITFTEDVHEGSIYDIYQVTRRLNEQDKEIKELKQELNAFKPVVFQDEQKGTILLYIKDYGDAGD